jgi:hypothetical protein
VAEATEASQGAVRPVFSAKQVRKNLRKKQDSFLAHSRNRMNKGFGPVDCLWEHLRIPAPTPPWRQPTAPWPPPPPCARVLLSIVFFSVSPCLRGEYPFGCGFAALCTPRLCEKQKDNLSQRRRVRGEKEAVYQTL